MLLLPFGNRSRQTDIWALNSCMSSLFSSWGLFQVEKNNINFNIQLSEKCSVREKRSNETDLWLPFRAAHSGPTQRVRCSRSNLAPNCFQISLKDAFLICSAVSTLFERSPYWLNVMWSAANVTVWSNSMQEKNSQVRLANNKTINREVADSMAPSSQLFEERLM